MLTSGPSLGFHLHPGTGTNREELCARLILAGPGVEVGLVGLTLALKGADEPAVEGVDLHLGRRIRLQDVEANLRSIADPRLR